MRKHGVENFRFDALCTCLKPEYLDEMERHFIAEFNCFERGYNMTCGGDSVSEETRAKISAANKGRKTPWYHKILETRKRNRALGLEKDQRLTQRRGGAHPMAKRYRVSTPDGEIIVHGLRQFCKEHGLTYNGLIHTLKGDKQKSHKGYMVLERFND